MWFFLRYLKLIVELTLSSGCWGFEGHGWKRLWLLDAGFFLKKKRLEKVVNGKLDFVEKKISVCVITYVMLSDYIVHVNEQMLLTMIVVGVIVCNYFRGQRTKTSKRHFKKCCRIIQNGSGSVLWRQWRTWRGVGTTIPPFFQKWSSHGYTNW